MVRSCSIKIHLKSLKDVCSKEEECVPCKGFSKALSPSNGKWHESFMFLERFSVRGKEPFWPEVLRISPNRRVVMDVMEVGDEDGFLWDWITSEFVVLHGLVLYPDWHNGRVPERFCDYGFGIGKAEIYKNELRFFIQKLYNFLRTLPYLESKPVSCFQSLFQSHPAFSFEFRGIWRGKEPSRPRSLKKYRCQQSTNRLSLLVGDPLKSEQIRFVSL